MTGQVTSWWLGDDVVLLRGASARRLYAALAIAVRDVAPRRNGMPLPADLVADLRVLRQAAEHARASETAGFAGSADAVSQTAAGPRWSHEDLVDAVEVARRLDVSVQYARGLCRGRFESACRVGREWRVSAAEVEAFAAGRAEARSA